MATEKDNVNAGLIATIVIAGALVVWAIVMVITAYTRAEVREQTLSLTGSANVALKARVLAAEHADMHAPAEWWDEEAKVVKIPTTHAEMLVVRDIAADPYAATPGSAPPPPPVEEGEEGALDEPPADAAAGTTTPDGTGAAPKDPSGTEEH